MPFIANSERRASQTFREPTSDTLPTSSLHGQLFEKAPLFWRDGADPDDVIVEKTGDHLRRPALLGYPRAVASQLNCIADRSEEVIALDQQQSIFETVASRPPQDEGFRCATKDFLILRSGHGPRLEGRTARAQGSYSGGGTAPLRSVMSP